jgi:hypothetical protein
VRMPAGPGISLGVNVAMMVVMMGGAIAAG